MSDTCPSHTVAPAQVSPARALLSLSSLLSKLAAVVVQPVLERVRVVERLHVTLAEA